MNRKQFLYSAGSAGLVLSAIPLFSFNPQDGEKLDPKMVQEFVGASHKDIEKVKSMLEEQPNLLNAAHDWKMGDFETGLGAASHVGYKDMVRLFLDKGAQANIFTACLFGKIDIVKPMLATFPNTLHAKGPHGFTLLHHAEKGGDEALEVKELLMSLGATETKVALY
ncbi:ankyrin repeat domain-containing protein [Aggregatimonas sangjinii]|uniref:Ankyrin repeat domain-containing protein n=1 Tax=Aggregatimonas sangjinii TaxID=2583587 RepID=A0A5B7STB5_9FLAO|nr:ankyrin repeat domain-containing protein [Aggregatimonas sangjinii]QCX00100.1 ankyrin repeat domain-containing protein [Aggregatimonas sangjinii]